MAILSKLKAQILRLCTLLTPSIFSTIFITSSKSMPLGRASMSTIMASLMMANVVISTRTENKKVHIGSTIIQSLCKEYTFLYQSTVYNNVYYTVFQTYLVQTIETIYLKIYNYGSNEDSKAL